MRIKSNILNLIFSLLCCSAVGQMKQYLYKRDIPGIKDQWHQIILPDEIFGKILPDFSDIRIYGITKNNDTVEAPYILQVAADKISNKDLDFNLLNESNNAGNYFYTFEIPRAQPANGIRLNFRQQNFDWRIKVEGSADQLTWYTITENYRVLSIKNELTDYKFTNVVFQTSKYRYFRLSVATDSQPALLSAKISEQNIIAGRLINYKIYDIKTETNKNERQSIITLLLPLAVPVSYLQIYVHDTVDYYRHLIVEYVTDSFKIDDVWLYNYSTLISATLNSIEKKSFSFNSTILQKLRIIIDNQDNKPLKIDSFVVKGYQYSMLARFTEPANYFLVYGSQVVQAPKYDIERFQEKIPGTLSSLIIGSEQLIQKQTPVKVPLFQNKFWLWGLMLLIICILGWFSIKMMREKS